MMNNKKGYTLLELMIIIAIIGMTLVIVTLVTKPSASRQLVQDAEYLGDVLEVMQQESQMQDKPLTIIVNKNGITINAASRNNMLGDYKWSIDEIDSKLGWTPIKNQPYTWQRTINQEPIQNPFHISLIKDNYKIILAGDGSGRYKTKTINLNYDDNLDIKPKQNSQNSGQIYSEEQKSIKNTINRKIHNLAKHNKSHNS